MSLYRRFRHHPYDQDLSAELLPVLREPVPPGRAYLTVPEAFVDHHGPRLEQLFTDCGADSDIARRGRYVLASQPESLIVFERLSTATMLLRGIWEDQLPETMLNDMAEIWSIHL